MSTDGRKQPDADREQQLPAESELPAGRVPEQGTRAAHAVERNAAQPVPTVPAQRDGAASEPRPDPALGPTDGDLLRRMRDGDDTAYEALYLRHAEGVRRYARTCCRDSDTADDLTAEVFARMLQAVRGGAGPEYAVRAYLLTAVRRVAAGWTSSARREQLVDDFAVFAEQAADSRAAGGTRTEEQGADVRALHEAEQSLAVQAFRSLPERWQAVLWHTEVEDEAPSAVAALFGLDANGTRVLAGRAREGLKQAYLQAHVSAALTDADGECAKYADRLGAWARGGLRTRAERGLRSHLDECVKCRLAAGQIKEVAGGIPAVVPVAVIGWFGAAGYAKVAALFGGSAVAGAATGSAAAGTTGAPAGGASGGAGTPTPPGSGTPLKAGAAAGVVAVAVAVVALALTGGDGSTPAPRAKPPASAPAAPEEAPPAAEERPAPPAPAPPAAPAPPSAEEPAAPRPEPKPQGSRPEEPAPSPEPGTPTPPEEPSPPTTPEPPETTPPPAPEDFPLHQLKWTGLGQEDEPTLRPFASSPVWQRDQVRIDGTAYQGGITVGALSSVTVDLNRECRTYEARAGVDSISLGLGTIRFSVYGDGALLWKSGPVRGKDPAVPVQVDLQGVKTLRLVAEPNAPVDVLAAADWAASRFSC